MKKIFALVVMMKFAGLFANDTLTRAQIFNFNVGDTFDYKEHIIESPSNPGELYEAVYFSRAVVNNLYYSEDSDTLFIVRQWLYPLPVKYDTLVLDSLPYTATIIDASAPGCSLTYSQFTFDSTSACNGRILNEVEPSCGNDFGPESETYVAGLGNVCSVFGGSGSGFITDSLFLIYYSKTFEHWGSPYNIANQSYLAHFTPIPEVCASWIAFDVSPLLPSLVRIVTGNRIPLRGHSYVEMLYSSAEVIDTDGLLPPVLLTSDSLIGYFRNDTLNQKVYFYNTLDTSTLFETYDFSAPAGGTITSLSQIVIGDERRTFWNEDCNPLNPIPGGYIEGVGGTVGLCQVGSFVYNSGPTYPTYFLCSILICFSVCGETLYIDSFNPDPSGQYCSFPTGATSINVRPNLVKVFPTVSDGQFNVEVNDPGVHGLTFSIMDLAGKEIKRFTLDNAFSSFDISNCASGMYIWQASNNNKLLQTGKLVKQ